MWLKSENDVKIGLERIAFTDLDMLGITCLLYSRSSCFWCLLETLINFLVFFFNSTWNVYWCSFYEREFFPTLHKLGLSFNGGLFEICTLMCKQRRNCRYLKQTSESQRSQNYAHFSKIVNNFTREKGQLNLILSVIIMLLSDWAQACSDFMLNYIHRSMYFF